MRRESIGYLDRHFAVEEERLTIGGLPCIRLIPKGLETSYRTIIFYHGLDSSKDRQRIRGHILAGFGYQVLLPDAVHHGERDRKETEDPEKIGRYFWQAILTSLRESDSLVIGSSFRGPSRQAPRSTHGQRRRGCRAEVQVTACHRRGSA